MTKRLSRDDERKLTNAIEKAATLAVADDTTDRSDLLATCLAERNIPSTFAKVASAAFNKRLTVLRFQKTADEHKADTFALSDADAVAEKLGATPSEMKTASVTTPEGTFTICMVKDTPEMEKIASVQKPAGVLYENRMDSEMFERHLGSVMDKQAAAHTKLMGTLNSLGAKIRKEKAEVADGLRKTSAFAFQTLCNVHGTRLAKAMAEDLPEMNFVKTGSAVDPGTGLSVKIANLLDDIDQYTKLNNAIADYQDGLSEFCDSAAKYATDMRKQASVSTAIRGLTGMTMTGVQAAEKLHNATVDALRKGYTDASDMYNAVDDPRLIAPGKILDAEFLTRDRFRDRMMSWSDMTADPEIVALADPETIFYATQKAMDISPMLARPDRRELLRTTVKRMLSQNNNIGLADFGALATIDRGFGNPGDLYDKSTEDIYLLDKKRAPEMPTFGTFLEALTPELALGEKDFSEAAAKLNELDLKADADTAKANADLEKTREQEHTKAVESNTRQVVEQSRAQQQEADRRSREAQQQADRDQRQRAEHARQFVTMLRDLHYTPMVDPLGNVTGFLDENGAFVSGPDMRTVFDNYLNSIGG